MAAVEIISDLLRCIHLLGLALGLGLTMYAVLIIASRVRGAIDLITVARLEELHAYISVSLTALWVTGLLSLYLKTGFAASYFTAALWMKLAAAVALTVSATLIGSIVLPMLRRRGGWRYGEAPLEDRLHFSVIGAVACASWFVAVTLGASDTLANSGALAVALVALGLYASCVGVGLLAAYRAPRLSGSRHALL